MNSIPYSPHLLAALLTLFVFAALQSGGEPAPADLQQNALDEFEFSVREFTIEAIAGERFYELDAQNEANRTPETDAALLFREETFVAELEEAVSRLSARAPDSTLGAEVAAAACRSLSIADL